MKYIYSMVISVVVLAACNPAATTPIAAATYTAVSSPSPTITPSTPTLFPTATQEFSNIPPGPTETALPALRPGERLTLVSLHMFDEQNGWGSNTGGHILHTSDGGNTWRDVTPRDGAYQEGGFFALDASTAWVTPDLQNCHTETCAPLPDNVTVWHTTDGGNSWQEGSVCIQGQDCNFDFDIVAPDYYHPTAIRFVDTQTGWLLVSVAHLMFQDRYRIYQTKDSGAHWSPVKDSFLGPITNNVTGLAFQDTQTGWMSTSEIDGASDPIADWSIHRSTDAGRTWDEVPLPAPDPLPKTFANHQVWCGATDVRAIPPHALGVTILCRVYTNPLSEYEFYFHSKDNGQHWASWLKTGEVDFIDPDTGWRSTLDNGTYDLEQTRDGGKTWSKLKAVKWSGTLDFVNEQVGWAIATSDNVSTLVRTADGGKTWEELKPTVAP